MVYLRLKVGVPGLEVHDLLLQSNDARPLLLEETFILLSCGVIEGFGNAELILEGFGALGEVGGGKVGNDGFVAASLSASLDCSFDRHVQLFCLL